MINQEYDRHYSHIAEDDNSIKYPKGIIKDVSFLGDAIRTIVNHQEKEK